MICKNIFILEFLSFFVSYLVLLVGVLASTLFAFSQLGQCLSFAVSPLLLQTMQCYQWIKQKN